MKIRVLRHQPIAALAVVVFLYGLTFGSLHNAAAAEGVVTQSVNAPFDKVVTNLKREITGHKLVIVKEVPYQKMVKMVGVKAEKMVGFEIFHPRYGKVLYEKDVNAFLEVPLRILARQSGSKVDLSYRKPSVVFADYPALSGVGKELDGVLADIVKRTAK